MDEDKVYQEIIDFISENGPTLPMEISYLIKKDSFIASAILSDLINKNKIKKLKRNFGDSIVYFVEGQEEDALKKLSEVLKDNEKKLIEKFHKLKVIFDDELEPQERYLLPKLQDFIFSFSVSVGEQTLSCHKIYNLKDEFFNQILKEKIDMRFPKEKPKEEESKSSQTRISTPKVEDKKHTIVESKSRQPITIEKQGTLKSNVPLETELEKKVGDVVGNLHGEILDKKVVTKNKEIDFKTKISGLLYTVKAKKKARINDSDLSLLFTQVIEEKRPMILVTNAKISKKTKEFKDKKIGDLIRVLNV